MSTLFVNGALAEDRWVSIEGDQPVPEGEDVLVSMPYFEQNRHALLTRNAGRLGVYLEAGEQVMPLADDLDHLALISLDFPSFADGRAFSKARLLRDKYGFEGQIRATGDVRIDQISHMRRSGCDALQVSHQPTIDALIDVKDPGLELYYQPAAVSEGSAVTGKSWARRAL